MSSNVLTETTVSTNTFMIEPNEKYNLISNENNILIRNCAEDVNYYTEAAAAVSKTQVTFQINLGENQFLNRGVSVYIESVPLIIKRTTPTATIATADDYVTLFLENYNDLAYKQFNFLNCLDTLKVTFGGLTHTVSNVSEMLKIMSNYYDESIVYDKLDASKPDIFSDYDHYANDNSKKVITTISDFDNKEFQISLPPNNQDNIFSNFINTDFNSRTPNLIFESATLDALQCRTAPLSFFLPLSIFGLDGLDNTPLYGVGQMSIGITLKSNIPHWMFCKKGTTFSDVLFNDTKMTEKFLFHLQYSTYLAPQYLASKLVNGTPEYKVNLPICEVDTAVQALTIPAYTTVSPGVRDYTIRAIPKHIYVYAMRKKDDLNNMTTTDTYAVPRSLSIEIAGKKTYVASNTEALFKLCKSQGMNISITQGKFLTGFPIRIDVSDHLGTPTNTLIGSSNSNSNRLRVTASFANLSGKTVDYEVKCLIVYQGMLHYHNKTFKIYESLLTTGDVSSDLHIENLYQNMVVNSNMLGGSFMSAISGFAKKAGNGAFNVIKAFASNKDGFRDAVIKKFNGGGFQSTNVIGGSDNHTPTLGGKSITSFRKK